MYAEMKEAAEWAIGHVNIYAYRNCFVSFVATLFSSFFARFVAFRTPECIQQPHVCNAVYHQGHL